jgi:hypothetical protein
MVKVVPSCFEIHLTLTTMPGVSSPIGSPESLPPRRRSAKYLSPGHVPNPAATVDICHPYSWDPTWILNTLSIPLVIPASAISGLHIKHDFDPHMTFCIRHANEHLAEDFRLCNLPAIFGHAHHSVAPDIINPYDTLTDLVLRLGKTTFPVEAKFYVLVKDVPFVAVVDAIYREHKRQGTCHIFDEKPDVVQGEETDVFDIALLVAMAQEQRAAGIAVDTYTAGPSSLQPSQPTLTNPLANRHMSATPPTPLLT